MIPSRAPSRIPNKPWPRTSTLVVLMSASIVVAALLTYQDVKRRYAESMEDFAGSQETLARSLAGELATRIELARRPSGPSGQPSPAPSSLPSLLPSLLNGMRAIEQPGALVVLVRRPGSDTFETLDGRPAPSELLLQGMRTGDLTLRVPRELAGQLGLPRRAAVAGLARLAAGPHEEWWVAAVASAYRARDRETAAGWRMVLAVLVTAGAVLLLGGMALYGQRRELRAEQALLVEDARRRREAELERASRAATIGTLAMGITHELSTPLGIIAARAEQLEAHVHGDERSQRSVRIIQEQADRMSQIIRGMLGLARGQNPVAKELTPLSIVRGAVSLVEHRFTEAGVRLRVDAIETAPRLRADQRLLEHALVNLLLNACDACTLLPGGSRQVTLSVRTEDDHAIFRVVDTGAGISPEAAARAMEPFFTTKPLGQGTGLGLAIAHEIVKSHRGTLRIAPRPEGGTLAEIALPLIEDADASASR
ncbi:MAG: HAMP domain-containing sensor histidine kinase [Polyangia bacterium]